MKKLLTCPVQNRHSSYKYEYRYDAGANARISPTPYHSSVDASVLYPAAIDMTSTAMMHGGLAWLTTKTN